MITITGTEQHRAWQDQTYPPVEQVRQGVWSIPVDCSHFPVRYTFCYAIANDAGEFVLIDPGHRSELGVRQLAEGLAVAGLEPEALRGVVVSHFHADHIGGAAAQLEHGAWFAMHAEELKYFPQWPDPAGVVHREWRNMDAMGVPADDDRGARIPFTEFAELNPRALPDTTIADGEFLDLPGRRLQVLWTPGHTPGHVCIVDHDLQLVYTGDHLLPRITSNVSAYAHDLEHDSLGDYLRSLDAISRFDGFEACPAHEYRFTGIAARAEQLREHHAERGAEVEAILQAQPDATIWQIAQQLHWRRGWDSLDDNNLRAALGETKAHVNHVRPVR